MHVGLHEIGLLSSYIPNERVWAYRIWSLFPGRERESLSHCRIVLCISLVNSRNWHRRWHFIRLRWNKERVPLLRVYLMHVRATRIVIPFVPSRFISNGFREHSLCACFYAPRLRPHIWKYRLLNIQAHFGVRIHHCRWEMAKWMGEFKPFQMSKFALVRRKNH